MPRGMLLTRLSSAPRPRAITAIQQRSDGVDVANRVTFGCSFNFSYRLSP